MSRWEAIEQLIRRNEPREDQAALIGDQGWKADNQRVLGEAHTIQQLRLAIR